MQTVGAMTDQTLKDQEDLEVAEAEAEGGEEGGEVAGYPAYGRQGTIWGISNFKIKQYVGIKCRSYFFT